MTAAPPLERFQSRSDFMAALQWGVQAAAERSARRMLWFDTDFSDWPLSDPALLDTLSAWLRLPQRQLVLLAVSYDELPRVHPRFVRWRVDWSHAVQPLSPPEELLPTLPRMLVDDGPVSVQLLDALSWRGRASVAVRDALVLRERADVAIQRSSSAWPVRQLGL